MASPMGISLGFLIMVLFFSHGSARKMVSEDMVKESNGLTRQLFEEAEPPEVEPLSSDSEPKSRVVEPLPSDSEPLSSDSEPKMSSDSEPKSGAPMADEATGLDGTQVECGHPVGLPAPYWRPGPLSPLLVPNCPTCGCGPAATPQPMPGCQPAYSPQPQPNYPPQPLYPPQPAYPPQPEPGCNPACLTPPFYPPHSEPENPYQPGPTYSPQPEGCDNPACQPQPQPNYPPQPAPTYQPQPEPPSVSTTTRTGLP